MDKGPLGIAPERPFRLSESRKCEEPMMICQPVEMEDDEESNMVESDMTSELQWPDDYNAKNMNFDIDEKRKAESSMNTNGYQ